MMNDPVGIRIGSGRSKVQARTGLVAIIVVLGVSLMAHGITPVQGVGGGPIGDDYNYSSVDPDCTKWTCPVLQECDPGNTVCHDMRVDNPPGYLFSENYACQPGWDPSSTHSGCGRDATMHSAQALTYTAGTGQRIVLTERYSPNRRDPNLCPIWAPGNPALNTAWPPDDYSMHWIGLRYSSQTSVFAYVVVEHACVWDFFGPNWKYGLRVYYTDTAGAQHYSYWTNYIFEENEWLDITVDVGNNGQNTYMTVKNTSTGVGYFISIGTNLGATSGSVEISAQYRHNEASRTDSVNAWISDTPYAPLPMVNLSTDASSLTLVCTYYTGCDPRTPWTFHLTVQSLNGFYGPVSLGYTVNHNGGPSLSGPASISISSGGSRDVILTVQAGGVTGGTYLWTISGTGADYTSTTAFTIYYSYCRDCLSPTP